MRKETFLFLFLPWFPILGFLGHQGENDRPTAENELYRAQLKVKDEPKCMDCHSDLLEWKVQHQPAKEGCDICHQTKVSEHPGKVTKGLFLSEEVPALCYTCHEGVKKDLDTARVVHKAVKTELQCMNCHSPHASDEKKLLIAEKNKLCLSCHNKDSTYADGSKMVNLMQLLSNSKVIHPAIKGGCTSCHKPHASGENYLLISAFPRERYAKPKSSNFSLCWECHDVDLFDLEKTTSATNFRNGELNLHQVHLKGARGRSCVLCHDVHASNNKFLIIDKVAFGEWKFDMNFIPAEDGGSCYPGCHNLESYKR